MLNKIKAICNFKEMSINDLEEINDNIFTIDNVFTIDNEEYYVLTDEEAQEMYEEMQKELIEEIGFYGFTEYAQKYIIDNCLNMEYFDYCLNEANMDYVDNMYEDELEEMFDTWKVTNKEDLIVELNNQYKNGLEFFKEIYTDKEINKIINENNLMDIDKVIEYCKETDGRGHTISTYDGEENTIKVNNIDYYIYRIY